MTCLYVHAKTMQKPCKMRRVRSANPPNIHSPRVPCYMRYMCYISQGKPLNISPRVPCYMCYMCYMALYSTYTTNFCAYRVYSTYSTYSKDRGESGGSAAWRVRYSTYSTYSKDPGESGCSAAWRGFNAGQVARNFVAILRGNKSEWSNFESNRGGSSMQGFCRESLHSRYLSL